MPEHPPEAVAVTLETGQKLGEWSEIELQLGLDCYSAVSLSGPFDHERKFVRKVLQPLLFPKVSVTVNDELVITGRVKDVSPSVDASQASVGVTVYSLANDLTEVCAPVDLLPLEFSGFDLKQIADRMVPPSVGVSCVFDGPPGAKFARIRCEPDGIIQQFLVDLALQRGYVLSDKPNGDLLFRSEAPTGKPVARLKGQPVGRVTAQFVSGNWFSTITGRNGKKAGKTPARYTQKNPLYKGSHPRSYTLSVGDTEAADVPTAVKAAIGRMIASVATYTVEDLPGWRTPSGDLWKPNTTVTLTAPEAMVYEETELLVRSVKLKQTAEAETATLSLVLPGTFGGKLPTRLPWD
jgi:prophage tail gpP-like protein